MHFFTPFPEELAPLGTPERRGQELRMLTSPEHWPSALLPLKRSRPEAMDMDYAVWDGEQLHTNTILALGYLMPVPDAAEPEHLTLTPEAVIDAGWRVD